MDAFIPTDIKKCVPGGIISVPVGLLSVDDHFIKGKRVAFNPRQVDEGGVESIAVRIRQHGYNVNLFTRTGIIRVRKRVCEMI